MRHPQKRWGRVWETSSFELCVTYFFFNHTHVENMNFSYMSLYKDYVNFWPGMRNLAYRVITKFLFQLNDNYTPKTSLQENSICCSDWLDKKEVWRRPLVSSNTSISSRKFFCHHGNLSTCEQGRRSGIGNL